MGHLPAKHNGKENGRTEIDIVPSCRPAQYRRQRARYGANKSGIGGDSLERGIQKNVGREGHRGQNAGQIVREQTEVDDAENRHDGSEDQTLNRTQAARGQGPPLGALHESVIATLDELIERTGPASNECGAEGNMEETPVIKRAECSQIEATESGQHREHGELRL